MIYCRSYSENLISQKKIISMISSYFYRGTFESNYLINIFYRGTLESNSKNLLCSLLDPCIAVFVLSGSNRYCNVSTEQQQPLSQLPSKSTPRIPCTWSSHLALDRWSIAVSFHKGLNCCSNMSEECLEALLILLRADHYYFSICCISSISFIRVL